MQLGASRARRWLTVVVAAGAVAVPSGVALADGAIVLAAPLTGSYAATGTAMREAAEKRLAGAGPLVVEDDGCQADKAVEAARRIVASKPGVVIGHPCSSAAIAAAPIYASAQIPFIATGARHGDLTDKRAGPLVFRLGGRDDRQGKDAASFLARASGGRAIAILQDRTFAMSTTAGDAAAALAGAAGQPPPFKVMQFPFVASELTYDGLVAKVIAFAGSSEGVGAVLFAGFPAEAIVVLRALRARRVTAPFLAVEAAGTAELGSALRPDSGEVFVLAAPNGDAATAETTAAAVSLWRTAMGQKPGDPGAALASLSIDDPALGRITFDAKGDADVPSYFLSAWRDGAWKPVAASGAEIVTPP